MQTFEVSEPSKVSAWEVELNTLVCQAYRLTGDEIQIIEISLLTLPSLTCARVRRIMCSTPLAPFARGYTV
jgi:hypothetical protein